MKRFIIMGVIGLFMVGISNSYADRIRITAVNESANAADLIIGSTVKQVISLGRANIKMFTAEYTYPTPVFVQVRGELPVECNMSMPRVGKQTIQAITMNLSTDKTTKKPVCVLDWQR